MKSGTIGKGGVNSTGRKCYSLCLYFRMSNLFVLNDKLMSYGNDIRERSL